MEDVGERRVGQLDFNMPKPLALPRFTPFFPFRTHAHLNKLNIQVYGEVKRDSYLKSMASFRLPYVHTSIAVSIYIGSHDEMTKQFSNVHHWTSLNLLGSVQVAFIFDGKTVLHAVVFLLSKVMETQKEPLLGTTVSTERWFPKFSVQEHEWSTQRVGLNHTKHINN